MKKVIICKTEFIDEEYIHIFTLQTNKLNEAHVKIKFEEWYRCLAYEVNALLIL